MINPFNQAFVQKLWQKLGKPERGFTLLETVRAVFIAGTVVVGSVVIMGSAVRSAKVSTGSLELQQLVQAQIETILQSKFIEYPPEPGSVPVTGALPYPAITVPVSGVTVSIIVSDAGTNYQFPASGGLDPITNVVQRIDVTAADETASLTMSFYKISVP